MHNKRLFLIFLIVALAAAALLPFGCAASTAQASVTLSDFRAQGGSSHITLFWETATELDNFGFHLWRGQTNDLDNAGRITANLIPSQVGGQPIGASYEYQDNTTQPETLYFYWLEAIDVNGLSAFYGPEQGMMTNSQPLGTATPGSGPTPLPTSTVQAANTPPSTNTPPPAASPSPTPRPQASPTPTRQPTNTPPPTANVAAPEPTKDNAATVPAATLPADAPPAAGIPPTAQTDPPTAPPQVGLPPQPTTAVAAGSGDAENDPAAGVPTLDSQLGVVGANAPLATPPAAAGDTPAAAANRLPPIALWGLAAGILLSLGGILAAAALFKRRQTDQ